MNLAALQHLVQAARALADDCTVYVLGSASLLASFPEMGDTSGPLAATYDADLCPEISDETTALMLHQALGADQAFHLRHGYHADILRPAIFETLPPGWRERTVPVPGVEGAFALDPCDLAAVKLLVARPKDIALVTHLLFSRRLDPKQLETRLDSIEKNEALMVRADRTLRDALRRAGIQPG